MSPLPPPAAPNDKPAAPPRVAQRRVHYFSGFDPRGAAYYHRLCKEQAGKPQPADHHITVGRRQRSSAGTHVWPVEWQQASGEVVHTEHVFMAWDDIIRAHWSRRPWALAREFVEAYTTILFAGRLNQARRLSASAVMAGLLPVSHAVIALILAVALGLGSQPFWEAALPSLAEEIPWLAPLLGTALAGASLRACLVWSERAGMLWLMHIFAFVARLGRGPVDRLDERVQHWVEQVVERQQAEPVDEVVLVGHSVGTLVMVDVVDRLLADPRWQALQAQRRTGMLTLGQCYPFVALVPAATRFRAALQRLSTHPRLAWMDVTARIDPLCFHGAHPLAGTGIDTRPLPNPTLHSAKFFQMYTPAHWSEIRRDKQRTHFLYLMAPDHAGNFNLLDTLYGPRPFEAPARQDPAC